MGTLTALHDGGSEREARSIEGTPGLGHFLARHPQLFHMTDEAGLESIKRHGLLSTTALLDLFEVDGVEREAIESAWRRESMAITHSVHGTAVIRDQKPMSPARLSRCLQHGLTPRDWYRHLNGKVFLWPSERRVVDLLGARAYRDRSHIVLRIDATSLLEHREHKIWAAPINTGSALYNPAPRGLSTFVPIDAAGKLRRVGEIAVDRAIPDVRDHLVAVERWRESELIERVPGW